jgi:3-hydroxyacyl-CoA dehydrogenase/3a,7a,12a-trihydroxy-5b-cholest-24-enoyl-CoA hydratase
MSISSLRFDDRVAIVTGAGGGLGRAHALLLGSRGCKVVVNDLGGSMHGGEGGSSSPAEKVVAEIQALGGQAVASYDSVENGEAIVKTALETFGRVDIVINNAGILRDTTFQKMSEDDWEKIYRVHVLGGFRVTKAAWNLMRDQGYGRIVFTASAAGIYGNFGQANYSMAKLGLVGLSNTLALEGKRKNVLVNTIAPIAGSRLTETVLPKELIDALRPEYVSPLVAWLCHESCEETGGLYEVGGGFFAKLRWERSVGKTFPLGRAMEPEAVRDAFGAVTSFEKSDHPPDITSSMQPVLANLQSKSRGKNDLIDADAAYGYVFPPLETRYDERDLALYGLAIGAGTDPLDNKDLRHVYELAGDGFQPLPTFAVTPIINAVFDMAKKGQTIPGFKFGFDRILHGEQNLVMKRPLPGSAKLTHTMKIRDVWDKGKNAVVVFAAESRDESGEVLFENELVMVVRGAGNFGGERGPSADGPAVPERAPDAVVEQKIEPNQALLYRLCGDWNPLHADPNFAQAFGFPRPILHGLCTYGYAARHVIQAMCDNDARYFKGIRARFADSVFPGETLITEMWKEGKDKVLFRCRVKERDKMVLTSAVIDLFETLPVAAPKAAPKAEAPKAAPPAEAPKAAAPQGELAITSAAVFEGVRFYVAEHPELVKQVGTVYQFKLTGPDSAWLLDLKNGTGALSAGTGAADCTLELADADFIGMASGALNPQKLYFGGKLKISGNVMASQKLEFLQKIDKAKVAAAMQKAGAAAPAPATAPAAGPPAPSGALTSADIFVAIGDYIASNAELPKQIGTVFQFKLRSPDSAYVVDVKNGAGSVSAGEKAADCTLELSDADFLDMTSGKADPQKLYFAGKLKISGNIMASQKLLFLKNVDPKKAEAAISKARSERSGAHAASAPAASAAPAGGKAAALFDALGARLAKEPGLAAEVGAVVRFDVGGTLFTLDGKASPPTLTKGGAAAADTTLHLADEDLAALASGSSLRDLYQHGRVRIDGDVRPAHRLAILKGLAG